MTFFTVGKHFQLADECMHTTDKFQRCKFLTQLVDKSRWVGLPLKIMLLCAYVFRVFRVCISTHTIHKYLISHNFFTFVYNFFVFFLGDCYFMPPIAFLYLLSIFYLFSSAFLLSTFHQHFVFFCHAHFLNIFPSGFHSFSFPASLSFCTCMLILSHFVFLPRIKL